jgi:hypothetical protein
MFRFSHTSEKYGELASVDSSRKKVGQRRSAHPTYFKNHQLLGQVLAY